MTGNFESQAFIVTQGFLQTFNTISQLGENKVVGNNTVYPNPNSGELNFILEEKLIPCRYHITDQMGRYIKNGVLDQSEGSILLNSMAPGLYYLILEGKSSNHPIYIKFIRI